MIPQARLISSTLCLREKDSGRGFDPESASTTASEESAEYEGKYARTDESIHVEYPPDSEMPLTPIVQGRGGRHFKRTLASFSLEDKVSVITGGARGLGLVMAQGLVASGSDLAIVDLNGEIYFCSPRFSSCDVGQSYHLRCVLTSIYNVEEEASSQAEKLLKQFQDENPGLDSRHLPKVTSHYADVADPQSVSSCIAEILNKHGRIDNLVTSAGFTENFDAISYPYDRMQKLWGVNVNGSYLFAIGVAKHLMHRQSPGSIVMIGSMSGAIVNVPQPQAPYNAAKAAVRHLASSLAVEWASSNIRVNCISPGYMLTAL